MTSWSAVDLDGILRGEEPAERPTRWRRSDGSALLYPGRLHTLVGEPSGGKTWLAAGAVAEAVSEQRIAVVIDLEDSPRLWVNRLRRLGATDRDIAFGLRYVRPSERLEAEGVVDLRASLDEFPSLVIVDAFAGLLALEGADPNAAADVERVYRRILRPVRECGASVLVLDHVTKSRETRGRWAAGSERKLSALDGAAYVLEVDRAFGRGRTGKGHLRLSKDRLGEVGTPGDVVADVHLVDDGTSIDLRLDAPEQHDPDAPFRPTYLMERVSRVLETSPGPMTSNAVCSSVKGKVTAVRQALSCLVSEGYVSTTDGPRRATLHHHVAEFREALDGAA